MMPDSDTSAKGALALILLGRKVYVKFLVEHFRSKQGHFYTHPGERDASVSANCSVLRALLEAPNPQDHVADITNILEFLCEKWWSGGFKDKWVSPAASARTTKQH